MLDCLRTPCAKCPRKRRIVPGGGPAPSRVMYVGEAPGKDEDRTGVAFSGRAGDELNNDYLLRAGTPRHTAYVTNAVLCRPDDNKKPDDWIPGLAATCAMHHLPAEIAMVKPEIIVLMGATACELVQGEPIDLELDHGIVQENVLFGEKVRVFPTYHPALGLHDSRAIKFVREDFEALGRELRDPGSTRPVNRCPMVDYNTLTTDRECDDDWLFLESNLEEWGNRLAVDTETHGSDDEDFSATPYSLQISCDASWGRWIYADDEDSLERLLWYLRTYRPRIIFQNAPFDIPVARAMGIDFDEFDWDDTMFRGFHLGMRHGLKTMGWRLCGVRMQTFEELVRPYWEVEAWKFLNEARLFAEGAFEEPEPEPVVIKTGKRKGEVQMRRPQSHYTRINRIFQDLERGKHDVLPGKRWEKLPENVRKDVVDVMEKDLPPFSLKYVPEPERVEYGCRDADMTLRVWEALRQDSDDKRALRSVTRFDSDRYGDLVAVKA